MTRLIPVLVAALSAPAFAFAQQGGPTVYGIVDASVRHTSGMTSANAPAAASATGLASGVDNTSRIGFRSREDLGDGMYALFNLETGLNVDTGSTANVTKFFDRAAIVGVGGSWGQVTLGRQTNLLADAVSPVDAVGMRFAAFNPNIVTAALSNHGLGVEYGATGSSSGSYRLDNSFKYTGFFGPVTARAMYSVGENAGSTAAQHSAGAGLAYTAGGWVISGAFQRFTTAADLLLRAATLGAAYQSGSVRLAVNTARNHAQTSASARTGQRTHSAGATWSATNTIDLTAAWYRVERERTGAREDGYSRTMLFAEYKFSRRTKLYAELDRTRWRAGYQGAAPKSRATGISSGIAHTF
ncbi:MULTISPECIES: porin [unclassified Acidovorax]|uniref:porin n=1 Tax=unclassified Acidovorax TaxID=2684926 RepID=UPI001C45C8D3|nr:MULTISPECIES: porin [unclassified Acidovorax]MBV7427514.1 porin [Acidovorax sp. sif0732]MBV7449874.1 porin [Acidovorax sp. sif0715]